VVVPVAVSEGLGSLLNGRSRVLSPGGRVSNVLNVLAGSVAGAVIGAGSSLAALAFISIEASALARGSVANAAASALKVLVEPALGVGGINPGDLERADALRAIARVVRQAHAPVIVAFANVVGGAVSVARALVVASSADRADEGNDQKNSVDHFQFKIVMLNK
jgi:hypothetical protein